MNRIVTALFEPLEAKKLLPMRHALQSITASHAPGTAPPDFDHPITKAIVQQLPKLTYGELEAVRAQIMKSNTRDKRWVNSSPVERDGWLRLVNAEMQQRDRDRELAGESLIDFLTKGVCP